VNVLRLRCECNRNLADATEGAWQSELEGIRVTTRPNVVDSTYRPPPPGGYRKPPTYEWRCRCGDTHQLRHSRIVGAYRARADDRRRVVTVVVGIDV
jgi:hypothetical protein